MGREFDVLILGGGPAGIAAAMWADELGLTAAIVDRNPELGGQLLNVYNPIKNFPGAEFRNGDEMRGFLSTQISQRSVKLFLGREVVAVDVNARMLSLADGETITGKFLILATGVRRRKLGVPGEREFLGKGILISGAKDPAVVAGKTVAIVGGGDSAVENALILSTHAARVHLIHRRNEFKARRSFLSQLQDHKNIDVLTNTHATEFRGADQLESVVVFDGDGISRRLDIDHALIRIGYQPNSELFRDQIECDPSGYVLPQSFPHLYVAGDLRRPDAQTLMSAFHDGSSASINIAKLRSDGER